MYRLRPARPSSPSRSETDGRPPCATPSLSRSPSCSPPPAWPLRSWWPSRWRRMPPARSRSCTSRLRTGGDGQPVNLTLPFGAVGALLAMAPGAIAENGNIRLGAGQHLPVDTLRNLWARGAVDVRPRHRRARGGRHPRRADRRAGRGALRAEWRGHAGRAAGRRARRRAVGRRRRARHRGRGAGPGGQSRRRHPASAATAARCASGSTPKPGSRIRDGDVACACSRDRPRARALDARRARPGAAGPGGGRGSGRRRGRARRARGRRRVQPADPVQRPDRARRDGCATDRPRARSATTA